MAKAAVKEISDVPKLKKRDLWMHKGDAGKVFCVAGSAGMVGAAVLCSRSSLRAGAGLVRVGMPWRLAAVLAGRDPNVMTLALPETEEGTLSAMAPGKILEALKGFDVLSIGPGISTNAQTVSAVRNLLPQVEQKLVIDADALTAIAKDPGEVLLKLNKKAGKAVLAPHPGEMHRLLSGAQTNIDLGRDEAARKKAALEFAQKFGCVVVLKGHRTIVTDGEKLYINTTGNPGMAKAGMGDVLTGVIAAMRAQGYEPLEAAILGAHLHGLAGDLTRDLMGEFGMIASDVIEGLPEATKRHAAASASPGQSARMKAVG